MTKPRHLRRVYCPEWYVNEYEGWWNIHKPRDECYDTLEEAEAALWRFLESRRDVTVERVQVSVGYEDE